MSRGERVSQTANASPQAAWDAFMDPAVLVEWPPPPGPSAQDNDLGARLSLAQLAQ